MVTGEPVICSGGELGSERRTGLVGKQRRGTVAAVDLQQFGNAEVEEFHLPLAADKNVRRFDVTVDNQAGVGVGYRRQDVEKQPAACVDIELALVAVMVNWDPVHELENKIRTTCLSNASVEKFGDVWMREAAQNHAFAAEAFFCTPPRQPQGEELDRGLPLKTAVAAFSEPNRSHAALSNHGEQAVGADSISNKTVRLNGERRVGFQKPSLFAWR